VRHDTSVYWHIIPRLDSEPVITDKRR